MLEGSEVKSLRNGKANIAESYAAVEGGELWLINGYIPAYAQAKTFGHDERRRRKLLVSRRELARLWQGTAREGMTLVPLRLYFNERGQGQAAARHRQGQEARRQARHRGQARLAAPEGPADARAGLTRQPPAPTSSAGVLGDPGLGRRRARGRRRRGPRAGTSGAKTRVALRIQGMSVTSATLLKPVRCVGPEPGVAPDRAGGEALELRADLVEHLDLLVPRELRLDQRARSSRHSPRASITPRTEMPTVSSGRPSISVTWPAARRRAPPPRPAPRRARRPGSGAGAPRRRAGRSSARCRGRGRPRPAPPSRSAGGGRG